jgi:hypothetical protein
MANEITLTPAELAALRSLIDGDMNPRRMSPAIRARLDELRLIERREWPNGPTWRTARGKRVARAGL